MNIYIYPHFLVSLIFMSITSQIAEFNATKFRIKWWQSISSLPISAQPLETFLKPPIVIQLINSPVAFVKPKIKFENCNSTTLNPNTTELGCVSQCVTADRTDTRKRVTVENDIESRKLVVRTQMTWCVIEILFVEKICNNRAILRVPLSAAMSSNVDKYSYIRSKNKEIIMSR